MRRLTARIGFLLVLSCAAPSIAADCNGNGVEDDVEVTGGQSEDCNGNGLPDACDVAAPDFRFFTTLELGDVARSIRAMDLDGDGRAEMVVGHRSGVTILRAAADGAETFETVEFSLESTYLDWRFGDLDADGTTDFVGRTQADLEVWWGTPDGIAPEPARLAVPFAVDAWGVGDATGDGAADLVLAGSTNVAIIPGDAERTFADPQVTAVAESVEALALLDLDGDALLDVALVHEGSAIVSLWRSAGDGTLEVGPRLESGVERPSGVLVVDANADERMDLFLSGRSGRAVLLQEDGGQWQCALVFEGTLGATRSLAQGDFDRDGDPDFLGVFTLGEALAGFVNDGDGRVATSIPFPGSDRPRELVAGDFDGDGDDDIAVSSRTFATLNVLWNGDARGNAVVSMSKERVIEIAGPPHSIQTADVDRDGALDVVVINGSNRVFLLMNDGTGVLGDPREEDGTVLVVDGGPFWSLTTGEFDGDGAVDLAIADGSRFHQDFQNFVHVLLNGGDASFSLRASYPSGDQSSHVTAADLDGDGLDEILTTAARESALIILPNSGDGTFGESRSVRVGNTPFASVAQDLDGDGDRDVAVANWISGELTVLIGDGTGHFPESASLPVISPVFVAAVDADLDGDPDLVAASNRTLITFENDGSAAFSRSSTTSLVNAPRSFVIAEIDGDGRPDIVTSSENGNAVAIALNTGGGQFVAALDISVGTEPRFAAAGDLDGDGDTDIVSGNHGTHDVTVLFNERTVLAQLPFLEGICTPSDFDVLSAGVVQPAPGRATKYVVPASDDPALLPPVFQNVREFPQHVEFLAAHFPEAIPAQDYEALVAARATRRYFAGTLYELDLPTGSLYAFSVISGAELAPTEALSLEEVRSVRERLAEVFSLGSLAYYPASPRDREVAEGWQDPGFEVFFDALENPPPVEPPPVLPTPTFEIEIPPETAVCGVFVHSRSSRAAFDLQSQLRLVPGVIQLDTALDTFSATLFEELVVGPEQDVGMALAPGVFRLTRFPQPEATAYRYRYDQSFQLGEGRTFELTLFNLTFRARGEEPLDGPLVLDERFLTEELQLQGFEDLAVTYSSCAYDLLPLWEIAVEIEGGGAVRLLERHEPPVPGETGPASLVRAELALPGIERTVTDYWELVYSASRHNRSIEYWIALEPPVAVEGLERPVRVVEVVAPDDLFDVTPALHYLDAEFARIRSFGVASFVRGSVVEEMLFRRGDAEQDGRVNLVDVTAILGHLFRREALACGKAADTNDDGRVNIVDAIALVQSLFARGDLLPPPTAECGPDPTADDLICEPGCVSG